LLSSAVEAQLPPLAIAYRFDANTFHEIDSFE